MAPSSPRFALAGKRIFVAGHRGMVGSALVRRLAGEQAGILTADRDELDLTRQAEVEAWMQEHKPQVVVIAAARVGGILANSTQPVEFLTENLLIELNLIHAAHAVGVEKLLLLGSSCIYPRDCPQPIREDYLLTGPLEPTNAAYALAKIAGVELCRAYHRQYGANFICAMPTNLYGPGDNFDLVSSHVLPALLRKMHDATVTGAAEVTIWGSGTPRREFMHVDDLADACVFLLHHYARAEPINVGWGRDISIADLATAIAQLVGFSGRLRFDNAQPDGVSRKLLDTTRLSTLGWRPQITLQQGLERTLAWYLERSHATRGIVSRHPSSELDSASAAPWQQPAAALG